MVLSTVTERTWIRVLTGKDRGLFQMQQENYVDGDDCIVEFRQDDVVVARMTVYESNTDKLSVDCKRLFEVAEHLLDITSHIYVPTDEEYEEWAD